MLGGRERRRSLNSGYDFGHNIGVQIAFDPAQVSGQFGNDFCRGQAQNLVAGDVRVMPEVRMPRRVDFHLANCERGVRFDEGVSEA